MKSIHSAATKQAADIPGAPLPSFTRWIESTNNITQQFLAIGGDPEFVSLAGGLPAAELYPHAEVAQASQRALARWGTQALEYGPVEGLPALRTALADRFSRDTGVRIGPANVLVTSGAMQGLDLMGKILIDAGDLIVSQFPAYLGALDAWRPRGPRFEKLDWHTTGSLRQHRLRNAKFVYAVPNYSNPTGVLVPQAQRQALLDDVHVSRTWLLEDDPYGALQYDGDTGPSLLALDARKGSGDGYRGPVIYLGTLSKTIAPGLRVGWAIGDERIIQTLALAKMSTDLSGCMFTQATALELFESGFDETHAARIVAFYRERRDALCEAAHEHLAQWFDWDVPPGGMFVWMRARHPAVDTNDFYGYALEEKVAFVPSSVFDPSGGLRNALRVNFTRAAPDRLRQGVRRLARAMSRYCEDKGIG